MQQRRKGEIVHNATENIEHLEGSIANVQDVLDNAQRMLAIAQTTAEKANTVTASMRRTALVLAAAGALIITLGVIRRGAR